MTDPLAEAEAEMAAAAEVARVRRAVALAWLRSADRALSALTGPCWGGPVDAWHKAADAVAESAETVAAYEHFGALD